MSILVNSTSRVIVHGLTGRADSAGHIDHFQQLGGTGAEEQGIGAQHQLVAHPDVPVPFFVEKGLVILRGVHVQYRALVLYLHVPDGQARLPDGAPQPVLTGTGQQRGHHRTVQQQRMPGLPVIQRADAVPALGQQGAHRVRLHQRHVRRGQQDLLAAVPHGSQAQPHRIKHLGLGKPFVMHKHNARMSEVLLEHLALIPGDHQDTAYTRGLQHPDHVPDDRFLPHGQQGFELSHAGRDPRCQDHSTMRHIVSSVSRRGGREGRPVAAPGIPDFLSAPRQTGQALPEQGLHGRGLFCVVCGGAKLGTDGLQHRRRVGLRIQGGNLPVFQPALPLRQPHRNRRDAAEYQPGDLHPAARQQERIAQGDLPLPQTAAVEIPAHGDLQRCGRFPGLEGLPGRDLSKIVLGADGAPVGDEGGFQHVQSGAGAGGCHPQAAAVQAAGGLPQSGCLLIGRLPVRGGLGQAVAVKGAEIAARFQKRMGRVKNFSQIGMQAPA